MGANNISFTQNFIYLGLLIGNEEYNIKNTHVFIKSLAKRKGRYKIQDVNHWD